MLENNDIYVDHRIDGLEIQITRLFINPNVDHRIDGLEKVAILHQNQSMVDHRIDGLEKNRFILFHTSRC